MRQLPSDFPAPICIVLHIPPDSPSFLAQILSRDSALPVKEAEDGELYRNGTIYVAPPDKHLLVERGGKLRAVRGPRENRHRPAVDPLFRSAAAALGPNAVGVILTGTLDDGTARLFAIKKRNGIAVVQDPEDARYPAMPSSALEQVAADHILPLSDIGRQLTLIVNEPRRVTPARPDCGVGHAYSPESMLGAQCDVLEEALWTAAKTLEESARLSHRLARAERERGHDWLAKRFESKEQEARERVEVIRRFLLMDTSEVPVEVSR